MQIKENFLMVSNYNADISWILDYTDNYIIYDRSDTDEWIKPFDQSKVIKVANIGWDIYDKLTYIIDNYDNLPKSMIMTKGNIFKYITRPEFDKICNNTFFTPIFTKNHKTYMSVCFYGEDGIYNEINNSWYLNALPTKYFTSYNQFIEPFGLPIPEYLKFAPGSNYIVTKENIQKHKKAFYEKLRCCIDYGATPGEAQIIERFLYTMWTTNKEFTEEMIILIPQNPLFIFYKKVLSILINKVVKGKHKNITKKIMGFAKSNIHFVKNVKYSLEKTFKKIVAYPKKQNYLSKEQIQDYKKTIKIYDIFTYNGEADILEIRLNILKDHVDYFVIIEAPTTFSGIHKPLYFQNQKERFAPFLAKIKYFVINDYPNDEELCRLADASSNVPKNGPEHWRREFYQKESIKKALTHLNDDDICFIGDVDEIWNPEILIDYTKNDIFKLRQKVYSYYLNNRSNEPWAGTLVTKYKNIKNSCLNHLRTKSKTEYTYLQNGGWHFTSIGGLDEIRRKLNDSYTDESYNTKEIQENLEKRFGKSDYIGRKFKFWIDEKDLPIYLKENKEKYRELFKE